MGLGRFEVKESSHDKWLNQLNRKVTRENFNDILLIAFQHIIVPRIVLLVHPCSSFITILFESFFIFITHYSLIVLSAK